MKLFTTLVLFIFSGLVMAHQSLVDEHATLIPIPAYSGLKANSSSSGVSSIHALKEFMELFDGGMKNFMGFELNSPEHKNWSNLPARFVQRSGISIAEMSDIQRMALFKFLSVSLGERGYNNVANAIVEEAFLNGDSQATFMKWNPVNYWLSVYGNPSELGDWGWQFGGHHLALNISVSNGVTRSMSPSFIDTEPAIFSIDGNKYEAIVDMHQAGFAVYQSLNAKQKYIALLQKIPNDVVTGPGRDGLVLPMVGVSGSKMTPQQKALLVKAIRKWVSVQPDENASERMKEIARDIDQTSFAWIGNDEVNTDAYFRIQGPAVIIELLSTEGNVGDSANGLSHYHTMYRNPKLDYGQKRHR